MHFRKQTNTPMHFRKQANNLNFVTACMSVNVRIKVNMRLFAEARFVKHKLIHLLAGDCDCQALPLCRQARQLFTGYFSFRGVC